MVGGCGDFGQKAPFIVIFWATSLVTTAGVTVGEMGGPPWEVEDMSFTAS